VLLCPGIGLCRGFDPPGAAHPVEFSAVMMGALGVLTIIKVHESGPGDFSELFLVAYMVMFVVLLFIYKLQRWQAIPHTNKPLRRNFGFLYGPRGKGLYWIAVACLCLGLGSDTKVKELNYAMGASFFGGGLLHFFIICFHPETAQSYVPPMRYLRPVWQNNSILYKKIRTTTTTAFLCI
jgi:hypothetical protein